MATELPDFSQRLEGGLTPSVTDLISSSIKDITDDIGPHALAGLGIWLFSIVLAMIIVPVVYVGVFGGMTVGMLGGLAIGAIPGAIIGSEGLIALGTTLGMTVGMLCGTLLPMVGLIGVIVACTAPLSGSMYRAVRAHQLGEKELDIGASFSTIGRDLGSMIMAASIVASVAVIAMCLCYFPVLFVGLPLGFVLPAVALHRRGAFAATSQSIGHVSQNIGWHMGFWGLGLVVGFVGAYVPVIGPMVGYVYYVKGYRAAFGDGEEPHALA